MVRSSRWLTQYPKQQYRLLILHHEASKEPKMDTLLLTISDQIATITLNRPEYHNAITYEMWTHFAELCTRLDGDDRVRVVIVQGAGDEAFSAGGDISEFEARRSDPWQAKIYNGKIELALKNLERLNKPTIAMIKGYCVGGGIMLAAHCDLRFSADNALYGIPVARLGALVNYFELQRMIQLIGLSPTLDLLLSGRMMTAADALMIGFCNQVAPLAEVETAVLTMAQQVSRLAPLSHAWHKQMVRTVLLNPDLTDLNPEEGALPDICFDTEDYAEGVQAFLQKREPRFRGR
jgi:enoyl-CoA hydratase